MLSDRHQTPRTEVLVLSESLTSLNFGVCGYPRQTTPHLAQHLAEFNIFCDAYSSHASTIAALTTMLTDLKNINSLLGAVMTKHRLVWHDKSVKIVAKQSLLSNAKMAGYKIFWLSNQDDSYLSSFFANLADQAVFNNKRSGRSSSAKDEELFFAYQAALQDKAKKKLIILHLIGAHPNYALRYPQDYAYFPSQSEASIEQRIAAQLELISANFRTRNQRDEYDNAVRYQDWLLFKLWQQLLATPNLGQRSFTYISDHGNEVGHEKDYAGHSPSTEAGYKIPIIQWYDGINPQGDIRGKAIDARQLDEQMLLYIAPSTAAALGITAWQDPNYHFDKPKYWERYQRKLKR